ncbi:MAG: MerR family transcriptional regulator [Spirochaetales bacterium]|nr:MerR family transcriptional regulator [Exilispira sp.]NMC67044.1 MerR family transcriptional regulator [Spirochaetales bacterium]
MENDKIYYSISEVCKICELKPHTLRSWEEGIVALKPKKNKFGHRIYTSQDIKKIKIIKKLVYIDKLSIKGINDYFLSKFNNTKAQKIAEIQSLWYEIYDKTQNLKKFIDNLESNGILHFVSRDSSVGRAKD